MRQFLKWIDVVVMLMIMTILFILPKAILPGINILIKNKYCYQWES